MAVFPSTIPEPSTVDGAPVYRILESSFGDGYTQFSPDGTNIKETTYTLTWDIMSLTDFVTLQTFLDTQTPVNAFDWNDPNDGSTKSVRFIKDSFTWKRAPVLYTSINLKIKTAYGN